MRCDLSYRPITLGALLGLIALGCISSSIALGGSWGTVIDIATALKGVPCSTQALDTINQWEPGTKTWNAAPLMGDPGTNGYRTPTTQLGVWLEVWTDEPHHSLKALRVTPNSTVRVIWSGDSCSADQSLITRAVDQKVVDAGVSDTYLASEVGSGAPGILYVWSPGMPHSVRALPELKTIAKEMNLKFIPILDASSDLTASKRAIEKLGLDDSFLRKNQSIELIYRGLTNHYPSMLIFNHGKFTSPVFPGYKKPSIVRNFIKRHLQ